MKKIIYVVSRKAWPPYAGQARLAYSRAKVLKQKGYETELVCICRNSKKLLKENKNNLLEAFTIITPIDVTFIDLIYITLFLIPNVIFKKLPLRCQIIFSKRIIYKFNKLLFSRDSNSIVHFYSISTYPLWKITDRNKFNFIIDMVDSATLNIKRKLKLTKNILSYFFWKLELQLTHKFEYNLPDFNYCKCFLSVSKKDMSFFRLRKKYIKKVPFYRSSVGVNIKNISYDQEINSKKIIFFGSLGYEPNINAIKWLIDNVMCIVWKKNSNIKLIIAGSKPNYYLKSYCSKNRNIILIENPVDMESLIKESKISVAPIFSGSGQQFKVIESIASGVPVITSSIASRALGLKNKKQVLVANQPKSFANLIIKLFEDMIIYNQIRKDGFEFVFERYNWEKIVDNLIEKIY